MKTIFYFFSTEFGFCCGTQPLIDHQCPEKNCYFTHDRFFFIYKMKCSGEWRIFMITGTLCQTSGTMMQSGLGAGPSLKILTLWVICPNKGKSWLTIYCFHNDHFQKSKSNLHNVGDRVPCLPYGFSAKSIWKLLQLDNDIQARFNCQHSIW